MKVAIVGDYPLNLNIVIGGVEALNCNLVEGLCKLDDLEIHVITCKSQIKKSYTVFNKPIVIHYLSGQKRFGNITLGLFDRRIIRKKIEEIAPDVINSHDHGRYTYAALQTNYPTVVTISTILSESSKFEKSLVDILIRKIIAAFIERRCLKIAKDIIIISPHVENKISSKTNATFHYVPNSVKDEFFRLRNKEEENRILFAGRVIPLKGIHVLLKAVEMIRKKYPNIKLYIAGAIQNINYYNKLRNFVEINNLYGNVEFLGLLNESQLMDEYAKCEILVLPSFHETFSMVVAQAMAAGKAIIATKEGGLLIENNRTGLLVECGDIKGLAEKIVQFLNDDNLRYKMGKNAKQEALKRFKSEMIARKTYEVYQEILNRQKV